VLTTLPDAAVDHRLVVHDELPRRQRLVQLGLEQVAGLQAVAHGLLEQHVAVLAVALGPVHGHVGVPDSSSAEPCRPVVVTTPTLALTRTALASGSSKGASRASSRRSAAASAAGGVLSSSSTANSSPPRTRPRVDRRRQPDTRSATAVSSWSRPGGEGVVDHLKSSRSMNSSAYGCRRCACSVRRRRQPAQEQGPVRGDRSRLSCSDWWVGLGARPVQGLHRLASLSARLTCSAKAVSTSCSEAL
jgi:hypothetical protein